MEDWTDKKGTIASVNLDPEFQRAHVWSEYQQRKYVEYVLQGGNSGKDIYFNCNGWMGSYKGPFVLVDGKQRLEAVRKFLRNELPIFVNSKNLSGYLYKTIEGRLPASAYFNFNVNDLKTEKEVLKWYLEMNTGGTPHTAEEIAKVELMLEKIS